MRWVCLLVVAISVSLCGCGALSPDKNDGAGDAPISKGLDEPWVVLNAPDRFANIAFRCFWPDGPRTGNGNGIYATRSDAKDSVPRPVVVIPADPACPPR